MALPVLSLSVNTNDYMDHHEWVTARADYYASVSGIDRHEARQDAYFGFLAACKSYAEEKGASFKTHANIRIRGAILDAHAKRTQYGNYSDSTDAADEIEQYHETTEKFNELIAPISGNKNIVNVLYLRLVKGMKFIDVGIALGIKDMNVRQFYYYGINKLKAIHNECYM